jgi:hypothetical protein
VLSLVTFFAQAKKVTPRGERVKTNSTERRRASARKEKAPKRFVSQ